MPYVTNPDENPDRTGDRPRLGTKGSGMQVRKFDAVVIGGVHNDLVAAAHLAQGGRSVCVFDRRHVLGGSTGNQAREFRVEFAARLTRRENDRGAGSPSTKVKS
jgi:hypothetical protein